MSDNEEIRYVSDSTKSNAGRVYDYILGGDYNFPVDRQVANEILKKVPIIKKTTKLVRWFLGNAIDRAFKMGFIQFLDFASGLPTVDHIHTRIPEKVKDKVKIMYSDIDPITVQIGRKIIQDEIKGDYPSVKYIECDCRKPEILLKSNIIKNFFDMKQKFAIGFSGVFYFLTNEQISHAMKMLYDWAPVGSLIYFCDFDNEEIKDKPEIQAVFNLYKGMNQPLFPRAKKEIQGLLAPWEIKEPGLQILEKWLNISIDVASQSKKVSGTYMYGGFLEK